MAGLEGYELKAQAYIKSVCKQIGCVYATAINCKAKYSDEIVRDFETDGCAVGAVPAEEGSFVLPVSVRTDGKSITTIIMGTSLIRANHRRQIVAEGSKVVFVAE